VHNDHDPAIDAFIDDVVNFGSHYKITDMTKLYADDQSILFVGGDRTVIRVSREEMLAEFASRGATGEPPLSTERQVLHIEQQGDHATAILYRRMSPTNLPAMYELRLRKEAGGWKVAGETVTAWPRAEDAGDFLPPRSAA
jgi:hypothetical protein